METQGMEGPMTSTISGHDTSIEGTTLVNPLLGLSPHGSLMTGVGIRLAWTQRHLRLYVYSQVFEAFPLY